MFDYKTNHYFALEKAIPGGWTFTSYSHDGSSYRAIQGFNRDGIPKNFTIYFGGRERTYVCPKKKKVSVIVNNDMKNPMEMLLSEYILKSGYCIGEFCTTPIFKLIDEEKDAQEVVDVKTFRIKAESTAVELSGAELTEMAQLLGEFRDDKSLKKRMVLEFAGKDPVKFMSLYNDPSRAVKSLILKAIKSGILKQNGKVVTWDKEVVGSGEEQWLDYFTKDKTKLDSLKAAVKAFK